MIDKFDGKYEFLSNFYPSKVTYCGVIYPTVEHAFQAAKTLEFNERLEILNASSPGKAKRLGRKCALRKDWEEIKDDVMYKCIKSKFQNPELQKLLLETGEEHLVEGTVWHDNYWGNCSCKKCENIQGRNQLGKTLMKVREELRKTD